MKLKNSYILSIAMILLLVSVGSVCASDISSVDDVVQVNDGSDVVMETEPSTPITEKVNTTVVAENTKIKDTEQQKIDVTVNDNESKAITGITSNNLTVKEGNKTLNFNYENSKITISDKLSLGNHTLIILYKGNENYANSSKNIILSIFGNYTIQAPNSTNVNSTKIVEIPINITNHVDSKDISKEDIIVNLTYKDGNKTNTISIDDFTLKNNKIKFNYTLARNITTSTISIVYKPNETVKPINITLKRIYNVKVEVINGKNQYKNGNFIFKLVDLDNATENLTGFKLTLTIGTNIKNLITGTVNENGSVIIKTTNIYGYDFSNNTITIKYLNVGNNTVELSSDDLELTTNKVNLTIEQAQINIKLDNYKEYYNSDKNVTITVTNANNGEPVPGIILHLNMPQTSGKDYYIQTDANGQGKISVKQLISGTYDITVSNNDTKNMAYKNVSGKIIITKRPVTLKVTSTLTISYNTGNTATIKITDKTGKGISGAYVLVQLYTGSKSANYLFQTDKNGNIKFKAPLSVGKHKMVVSIADSRYSASKVTKYISVKKATAKIIAPKVTAYYKQGKYFTIKLVNTKKSNAPIYAAKLNVRVYISTYKYYNYYGQTGADGKLKLLIDLNPKTYKVEVRSADSKNFTASKVMSKIVVVKAPTKLYPAKLTAKKGTNAYFKVTVKNTKTTKVIPGVKVKIKVYTGKTYKTYTVKTNSKGIAQLNVKSLKVGTHKAIVSSANKYCVAKSATNYIKITK